MLLLFLSSRAIFQDTASAGQGLRSLSGCRQTAIPSQNEEVRDTTVWPNGGYCGAAPGVSVLLRRAPSGSGSAQSERAHAGKKRSTEGSRREFYVEVGRGMLVDGRCVRNPNQPSYPDWVVWLRVFAFL